MPQTGSTRKLIVKIIRLVAIIMCFLALTILTQIGGLIYLLSFTTYSFINKRTGNKILQRFLQFLSFLIIYTIITFTIVPLLAKPLGRVPLPLTTTRHVKPLNFLTCFLNRHYVRPVLKESTFEVAEQMNSAYPGTVINYLDAGFPFINKFPLFPHLSHNDGKKLDIAFCYNDAQTQQPTNRTPSPIGYGISEEPRSGEINTADVCSDNGYWQYSFLSKIMPQGNKKNFVFDGIRTKKLVNLFIAQPNIGKIFIEPHLKARLALTSDKIRFHGCRAVRHDDHIHVQLK